MAEDNNTTYEVCPHCGQEVALKAELMVQTCPNCGRRIVACSMCRACESADNYCTHCCLEYQAKVENEELGFKDNISITDAETKVMELANNEHIEDRVYELAKELVEKYTSEVEEKFNIVDYDGEKVSDENHDGSMWYDEVRETAMKCLFEKLSAFFAGDNPLTCK